MIGDQLKYLRKKNKLTQQQVASSLNIPRSTYALFELGRREPNLDLLVRLANFFGVSVDLLLFGENTIDSIIVRAVHISDSDVLKVLVQKGRITEEQYRTHVETKGDIIGFLPDRDINFFLDKNQCNSFLDTYNLKTLGIDTDALLEAALTAHSNMFLFNDDDSLLPAAVESISWWTVFRTADEIGVTPEQLNSILEVLKKIKEEK